MPSNNSNHRPVVVFDVLGTLVDQAGSLRRQVVAVTGMDEAAAGRVVTRWLALVAEAERRIIVGDAAFAPSHVLDAAALAQLAADHLLPADAVEPLTNAAEQLQPWPDTVEGLTRLEGDVTVMGLSNASRRVLSALSNNSSMRWDRALSAEDAQTYKPDPAVYQVALAATTGDRATPYLVAAHAWDLRAAAAAGLRTAYVPRPGGDRPTTGDNFDLHAENLFELHQQLLG